MPSATYAIRLYEWISSQMKNGTVTVPAFRMPINIGSYLSIFWLKGMVCTQKIIKGVLYLTFIKTQFVPSRRIYCAAHNLTIFTDGKRYLITKLLDTFNVVDIECDDIDKLIKSFREQNPGLTQIFEKNAQPTVILDLLIAEKNRPFRTFHLPSAAGYVPTYANCGVNIDTTPV